MSAEFNPSERAAQEARLTSLLLGELSGAEASALRAAIDDDAQLAKLYEQLKLTIRLVRETAASPSPETEAQPAPLRMSEERRQKMLAQFKTVKPKEFQPPPRGRNYLSPLVKIAALVAIMAILAGMLLPTLSRVKHKSKTVAVMSKLRQLETAKEQWALEQKAGPDTAPTAADLKPYLGRSDSEELVKSVAGENYSIGKVGEPPSAKLADGRVFGFKQDGSVGELPAGTKNDMIAAKGSTQSGLTGSNSYGVNTFNLAGWSTVANVNGSQLIADPLDTDGKKVPPTKPAITQLTAAPNHTTIVLPSAGGMESSQSLALGVDKTFSSLPGALSAGAWRLGTANDSFGTDPESEQLGSSAGGAGGGADNFAYKTQPASGGGLPATDFAMKQGDVSGGVFKKTPHQPALGDFYTGLTAEDAGGLRYLVSTNRINFDSPSLLLSEEPVESKKSDDLRRRSLAEDRKLEAKSQPSAEQNSALEGKVMTWGFNPPPAPSGAAVFSGAHGSGGAAGGSEPVASGVNQSRTGEAVVRFQSAEQRDKDMPATLVSLPPAPGDQVGKSVTAYYSSGDVPVTNFANFAEGQPMTPPPRLEGEQAGNPLRAPAIETITGIMTDPQFRMAKDDLARSPSKPAAAVSELNGTYFGGVQEPVVAGTPYVIIDGNKVPVTGPNKTMPAPTPGAPLTSDIILSSSGRGHEMLADADTTKQVDQAERDLARSPSKPAASSADYSDSAQVPLLGDLPMLGRAYQSEESKKSVEKSVNSASSPILSGYVDTSAEWNPGTGNAFIPGYKSEAVKSDGFYLDSLAEAPGLEKVAQAQQNKEGQLQIRTFRVDPNTFRQGLESITAFPFGESAATNSVVPGVPGVNIAGGATGGQGGGGGGVGGRFVVGSTNTMDTTSNLVRNFFTVSGLDFRTDDGSGKAFVFNDRKGVLTVRGTPQDLDMIGAAIETLNITPPQVHISAKFTTTGKDPVSTVGAVTLEPMNVTHYNSIKIENEAVAMKKEALLKQLKALAPEVLRQTLPTALPDPVLTSLLQQRITAQTRLAGLQKDHAPDNSEVKLTRELESGLNSQINQRVAGIMAGLEMEVETAKAIVTNATAKVDVADANPQSIGTVSSTTLEPANVTKNNSRTIQMAEADLARLKKFNGVLAQRAAQENVEEHMPKTTMAEIVDHAEGKNPAVIKIERDATDVPGVDGRLGTESGYDPYYTQTEFEVLKSGLILDKVIDNLKLDQAWSARESSGEKLNKVQTRQLLKQRLDIQSKGKTSLVSIGIKGEKPDDAARIANEIARTYQNYRIGERHKLITGGTEAFTKEMAEQGKLILAKEKELAELKSEAEKTNADTEAKFAEAKLKARRESERLQIEAEKAKEAAVAAKPASPVTPPLIPQPEMATVENAFSTFSLNVSDVAFKLAGASLEKGVMPDPGNVRSEEFINAFDYRDPAPAPGAPLAFAWERSRYPFAQNRDLLRFAVKTAATGRQPGRSFNIVLLLDNSGSMERADRVAIIRQALRVLATKLEPQDTLSMVSFARTATLRVDGVPGNQAAQVAEEIGGLTPQGGTNLEEAMRLAYATARRHYLVNGVNRVVLLTDGAANLGNVDPTALKEKVEENRKQGVALDCFGIGWEGYNDDLLETLSRNGDGRYGFINTPEEAATDFVGQLAGALNVAASDVKVQVEFNPKRVTSYRQIGYAKHQLTKEQFRDNTVNAAQIGAAESGNALYTVEVNPAGEGPLAIVRVRYRVPGTQDYHEHEWAVPYQGNALGLEQSSIALRLAGTASAFAEWLAASPFAAEVSPDRLLSYLSGVPEAFGADERPKKLEWMIRQAKSLAGK